MKPCSTIFVGRACRKAKAAVGHIGLNVEAPSWRLGKKSGWKPLLRRVDNRIQLVKNNGVEDVTVSYTCNWRRKQYTIQGPKGELVREVMYTYSPSTSSTPSSTDEYYYAPKGIEGYGSLCEFLRDHKDLANDDPDDIIKNWYILDCDDCEE